MSQVCYNTIKNKTTIAIPFTSIKIRDDYVNHHILVKKDVDQTEDILHQEKTNMCVQSCSVDKTR